MKNIEFALFLSLNGRAEEAITFYQEVFDGTLLFKITNQEFQERFNPELALTEGTAHFISHSVLQVGNIQLQIADNPIDGNSLPVTGNTTSFSLLVQDIREAKTIYEKACEHPETKVIQSATENEFAEFYSILQDPFGMLIQITKEKQPDPNKK